MRALAAEMGKRVEQTAETITAEMGSVISYTKAGQAPAPIAMLEYYAGLASELELSERRTGVIGDWTIQREPVVTKGPRPRLPDASSGSTCVSFCPGAKVTAPWLPGFSGKLRLSQSELVNG